MQKIDKYQKKYINAIKKAKGSDLYLSIIIDKIYEDGYNDGFNETENTYTNSKIK